MRLTTKIFIGMLMGILAGVSLSLFAPELVPGLKEYVLGPVGAIFLRAIKMLVVPLVLVSLIAGAASIGDPRKLGRLGGKTLGLYLVTTAIAITIGLTLANIVQPGESITIPTDISYEAKPSPPITQVLVEMVPTNPIAALVEGQMLQIIVFALLVGVAISILGEKAKNIRTIVDQANSVLIEVTHIIMKIAPYGVFALLTVSIGEQGVDVLLPMAKYMLVIIAALLLHVAVVYSSMIKLLGKMNPITFFKGFFPAMAVAFSTSSSSATLPVTIETAEENLRISKETASFVLPLGATINMDGTAIMQGVAAVFIAQVYGLDLTIGQQLTILLTATLASIGTAGVPGVGLITLAMVLEAVGLPVAGIALIVGVDRLLDMCRTVVNITGDATVALAVDVSEKKYQG